jgi:hypothetical protein
VDSNPVRGGPGIRYHRNPSDSLAVEGDDKARDAKATLVVSAFEVAFAAGASCLVHQVPERP